MNYRNALLRALRLPPKLTTIAYDKLYNLFYFKFFYGRYIDLVGKSSIRIHPSTNLGFQDSRIIIENGFLSVGYEHLLGTRGGCGIGMNNSTLHIVGHVELRPKVGIWAANTYLSIGNDTVINGPTSIVSRVGVSIGAHCHIAMNALIMDWDLHKHGVAGEKPEDILKKITIKDHCWIGYNVTILKGVTIGEGSIVGAHSVVTKDVEDHTMVAGVPARKIKGNVIWEP